MNITISHAKHLIAAGGSYPADVQPLSRRRYGLTNLLNLMAKWEGRVRFRWQLKEMLTSNPHLIDDIGLTKKEAEAEIAKRFWQG